MGTKTLDIFQSYFHTPAHISGDLITPIHPISAVPRLQRRQALLPR